MARPGLLLESLVTQSSLGCVRNIPDKQLVFIYTFSQLLRRQRDADRSPATDSGRHDEVSWGS